MAWNVRIDELIFHDCSPERFCFKEVINEVVVEGW